MNQINGLPPDGIIYSDPNEPDRPGEPNFVRKLRGLVRRCVRKVGELSYVDIAHDDWCAIYGGGVCDCDPDIIDRSTGVKLV